LVKEGDWVLNIGSHIGLEMMVVGRGIGPKGRLHIFEPIEFTYQIMRKNVYLNNLEDITTTYMMGGSNAYSKGISKMPIGNTGGSRISTDPNFK
jgi:FkbM family methyltransferase